VQRTAVLPSPSPFLPLFYQISGRIIFDKLSSKTRNTRPNRLNASTTQPMKTKLSTISYRLSATALFSVIALSAASAFAQATADGSAQLAPTRKAPRTSRWRNMITLLRLPGRWRPRTNDLAVRLIPLSYLGGTLIFADMQWDDGGIE